MPARLFLVSGHVQGVGFRAYARREAHRYGVNGWARNLADGRVEVHAEGPDEAIAAFGGAITKGPSWATVRHVESRESTMLNLEDFQSR